MLLVRAYNKADNSRARHIRNGTSEQFVVGHLPSFTMPIKLWTLASTTLFPEIC